MWNYLLHLWAIPPRDLQLQCPPAPDGQPAGPGGFFDDLSVAQAYSVAALASILLVLGVTIACYMVRQKGGGRSFDRRWWTSLAIAAVLSAFGAWLGLTVTPVTALANSCETNRAAFEVALPSARVLERTIAGLVWGVLAFFASSLVLTRTVGYLPGLWNGFYHNRGTPWPRLFSK